MSSTSTGEPPPFTRNDLAAACRMVRSRGARDDADDLAQEVALDFTRFVPRLVVLPGHTPSTARRGVLSVIARRKVAHHRARSPRGGEPVRPCERRDEGRILERLHGAAPSVEDQILTRGRCTLLRAAVDALRTVAPELHEVLAGELEGLPVAVLAARLGIPLGTAYTRAQRGRDAVRAQLRRWEDDDARGAVRMRLDARKGARERCS